MNLSTLNQNNLKHKGWQKVKAVLDKEMPEKKKRRPVFWLFFALILSMMASYVVWQTEGVILEDKPVKSTIQKQFASNSANLIDNNSNSNSNSNKIVDQGKELKSTQIITNKNTTTITELSKNRKTPYTSKEHNLDHSNEELMVKANDFQYSSLKDKASDQKEDLLLKDQKSTVLKSDNKSTIEQIIIYTLPGIQYNVSNEVPKIAMTSLKLKEKKPKKLDVDLFLTGGFGSYTYNDVELTFAGLRTSVKLSNRFSIGSGFIYHSLHTESTQSVQEVNGATGTPVFTTPKEGFVFDGEANNESLLDPINTPDQLQSPIINNVTYFKVPILLECKVYKYVDLYAGPQLNYLSKISSESKDLISKGSLNEITYHNKSINRFYPSYTAGIRIKPWNRLSIDLSANYDRKIELSSNNTAISGLAGLSFRLF